MGEDTLTYAIDGSEAEKAQYRDSPFKINSISSAPDTLKASEPTRNGAKRRQSVNDRREKRLGREERKKTNKTLEFRPEAKIWDLYMDDAEREAKDRVDLWKTGLDSLLIFAGLFAGIVSSFVIDSRNELLEESEQNLLSDIRDALRGGSIMQIVQIPVSAEWINGLWLLSLYITLFSAIMGVLAKDWLAKFVPANTRREAADAFHRYKLDMQAEVWYLEKVITLIPFLVQIAAFLFFLGLVIQSMGDNRNLGHMLLAFCISGLVVYFTMTFLPLLIPSSPFKTPLSDLLLWLKGVLLSFYDEEGFPGTEFQMKTDINDGLADILYTKLIQSPKPYYVDEAAAEISLPSFRKKWIDFLCRNESPHFLMTRFQQCVLSRPDNVNQRNDTLCNHLLAFLQLVDHCEEVFRDAKPEEMVGLLQQYSVLLSVLRTSLQPGYPLHRWNTLPESLRPLLFGVRAQTLNLLSVVLPVGNRSAENVRSLTDFHLDELDDRPWELGLQNVRSSHRLHVMLGACRGVMQGERHVKMVSTFMLSLWLAKAGYTVSETGRRSEWAGNIDSKDRGQVDTLALEFLSRLYDSVVSSWEEMAVVAFDDISVVYAHIANAGVDVAHA
ncbi:hypothetical protein H1R20_g4385, partial [Candolleomyces eurysporus]